METQDGFTVEQWQELTKVAIEQTSQGRDWLVGGQLSPAMAAHQRQLRNRAGKKCTDAERWIWTSKLLEQSSDEKTAKMTAAAFPRDTRVVDMCCGAGSDSVALARRGPILAVDSCEIACALTKANLSMHCPESTREIDPIADHSKIEASEHEIIFAQAESITIDHESWIHIDPDRRPNTGRTTFATNFLPGLDFLLDLMDRTAGGSVKLAPATKYEPTRLMTDTTATVELTRIGRQFIAWGGSVRQQRWWWNVESFASGTTTVSILVHDDEWLHWTVANQAVFDCDHWSNILEDPNRIQGYIGDTDGCVRAAGLQGLLAGNLNAAIVGNAFGYFVKRDLPELHSPLIDWFEIQATMPFDRKRLRAYLRDQNVGILEIKVRNIEVELELLRREMKLKGSEKATLLITRCGSKTVAIVGRRL